MKIFCKILLLFLCLPIFAEMNLVGKFDWQNGKVKKLCEGIWYCSLEFNEPRIMKLSVVKIDLSNPKIKFKITSKSEKWGQSMEELPQFTIHTERRKSRSFMEDAVRNGENMVIAVNGAPWTPWQKPWNHRYAQVSGLLISDGELIAGASPLYPSFIVSKDGSCDIVALNENSDLSNIQYAMSGFGIVLKNDVFHIPDDVKQLAPRTAYGLDKDKKTLYLLVIDGRQETYSMGSSVHEAGQLLQYFGAFDVINMDGGGSTTLLIRENNEIKKLNYHKNGAERTVAATLGIIIQE